MNEDNMTEERVFVVRFEKEMSERDLSNHLVI